MFITYVDDINNSTNYRGDVAEHTSSLFVVILFWKKTLSKIYPLDRYLSVLYITVDCMCKVV